MRLPIGDSSGNIGFAMNSLMTVTDMLSSGRGCRTAGPASA